MNLNPRKPNPTRLRVIQRFNLRIGRSMKRLCSQAFESGSENSSTACNSAVRSQNSHGQGPNALTSAFDWRNSRSRSALPWRILNDARAGQQGNCWSRSSKPGQALSAQRERDIVAKFRHTTSERGCRVERFRLRASQSGRYSRDFATFFSC